MEAEDGAPAGRGETDVPAEGLAKMTQPMFEVPPEAVTPDAGLYDELDLDSIDAIDLMVKLQDMTGKKVQPEDFKSARTVEDVVETVYQLVRG